MGEPVRLAAGIDRRPADARHALGLEPYGAAGNEAEAGDAAVLLALVECKLEPEADAEDWASRRVALTQHVGRRPEPRHRRARRADARQDREVGALEVVHHLGAEAPRGELDRADVAGAVARDRDRRHRTPFVDGSPSPSFRTAAFSARPNALYAASAM